MRTSAWLVVHLMTCATLAVAAPRAAVQDQRNTLTEEILDLGGTRRQIEQLPALMKAGAQPKGFTMLNPAVFDMLRSSMNKAFVVDKIYRTVFEHVKKAGSLDDLHAALTMVRSPMALKFTAWEVESSKPEALAQAQTFMSELQQNPPTKERVQVMARLDDATGGSQLFTEAQMASFWATARAVRAAVPAERRQSEEELKKTAETFKAQSAQTARSQTIAGMLFMYRMATQEELEQYALLLESKTGRWLSDYLRAGLRTALTEAMEAVGKEFGSQLAQKIVPSKPSASPVSPVSPSPAGSVAPGR